MLLYLIIQHSAFQVALYKTVLLVTCLSDISLAAIMWVSHPVVLFSGGYTVLTSNGFFKDFGWTFNYVTLSAMCALINSNIVILVMQFYYRYRFVCNIQERKVIALVKTIILPTLYILAFTAITYWYIYEPPEFALRVGVSALRNNSWPFDESNPPDILGAYAEQLASYFYVGGFLLTASGGYGLIIWSEWKMLKYLRSLGRASLQSTSEMHSEIHKALLALAVAPFFTCVIPIYYFMYYILSHSNSGHVSAFMVPMCASITLINPLTSAYFVKSYRYAILRALRLYRPHVGPLKTVATGALSLAPTTRATIVSDRNEDHVDANMPCQDPMASPLPRQGNAA
ncbi:hypothetical protein AAVH_11368 [Aphelenchoides avenae]|nr:hypothetical protein AAVH_11368 [Aphelenchus avenae]